MTLYYIGSLLYLKGQPPYLCETIHISLLFCSQNLEGCRANKILIIISFGFPKLTKAIYSHNYPLQSIGTKRVGEALKQKQLIS